LLGEPGLGKSTAIRDEVQALKDQGPKDQVIELFDLKSYGSEDRLVRDIFEGPVLTAWVQGSHTLQLFFDSLDECLLRINTLADLLLEQLRRYRPQLPRLRLRVACRTAEWPAYLEEGLQELWEREDSTQDQEAAGLGVYELAPLTWENVTTAACAYGVDVAAFSREVSRVAAVPLAVKPVTLHFLLQAFHGDERLPPTRSDLYEEGCRLLCAETSRSRQAAGLRGQLSPQERMAVAARIAAVMILCNRSVVTMGLTPATDPDAEISLRELVGGTEKIGEQCVTVDDAAAREVLATGLFSSRGSERMGWAHQTYAEFLTARYLVQRDLPLRQMTSLLLHPIDQEHVIPQLHETAAWLACMARPVLEIICDHDPQVLLRSDVAAVSDEMRARIVTSLLGLFAADKLTDNDLFLRGAYSKLNHPGLHEQLEPFLRDRSQGWLVRRVAIDLAEACTVQSLQNLLADMALDPAEMDRIRSQAAQAVGNIGDKDTRLRLRPLAEGSIGADSDDDLKGSALRALWPEHLRASELFALLTPPGRSHYYGSYASFLSYGLLQHLQVEDLPMALTWVAQRPVERHPLDQLGRLVDEILINAWDHLDNPVLQEPFAREVLRRLQEYFAPTRQTSDFREELLWTGEYVKRRQLVERLIPLLTAAKVGAGQLVHGPARLVILDDLPWLLKCWQAAGLPEDRRHWGEIIQSVVSFYEPQSRYVDMLLMAVRGQPGLHEFLDCFLCPTDLESPEAAKAREYLAESRRYQQPTPLVEPPPPERVRHWLQLCEGGEIEQWSRLNREMTLEPRSTRYGDSLEPDLTCLPGWKNADAETRSRIVATAKCYVDVGDSHVDDWFGTNQFDYRAAAGYRALLLLAQMEPATLQALAPEVWVKWIPIILTFPRNGIRTETERGVLQHAYRRVPDAFLAWLLRLVDVRNMAGPYVHVLDRQELVWDAKLMSVLEAKLRDPGLRPEGLAELLEQLLEHGSQAASTHAISLVPTPPPTEIESRRLSLLVAQVLLEHVPDRAWPTIWRAMQADQDWGRKLMLTLAQRFDHSSGTLTKRLQEAPVADLYQWLVQQFPPREDPKMSGEMHQVSDRERVADFRNGVLLELENRGTLEACRQITRLIEELPQASYLKWTLVRAKSVTLQRTWTPPRPEHLLALARDPQGRLVESGEQLLEVVIESLRRWEEKLQGTPPAAFGLWDQVGKDQHRPKDEGYLADAAVIHLQEDLRERGIVLNREVVIRRGEKPGGRGERTDIQVTATVRGKCPGTHDILALTIEAKGCWNADLDSAMQTQLRDRYLKDTECRHGLYLVGWYACPQWDKRDARGSRAPKESLDAARRRFDAQAQSLSANGVMIRVVVLKTALR